MLNLVLRVGEITMKIKKIFKNLVVASSLALSLGCATDYATEKQCDDKSYNCTDSILLNADDNCDEGSTRTTSCNDDSPCEGTRLDTCVDKEWKKGKCNITTKIGQPSMNGDLLMSNDYIVWDGASVFFSYSHKERETKMLHSSKKSPAISINGISDNVVLLENSAYDLHSLYDLTSLTELELPKLNNSYCTDLDGKKIYCINNQGYLIHDLISSYQKAVQTKDIFLKTHDVQPAEEGGVYVVGEIKGWSAGRQNSGKVVLAKHFEESLTVYHSVTKNDSWGTILFDSTKDYLVYQQIGSNLIESPIIFDKNTKKSQKFPEKCRSINRYNSLDNGRFICSRQDGTGVNILNLSTNEMGLIEGINGISGIHGSYVAGMKGYDEMHLCKLKKEWQ